MDGRLKAILQTLLHIFETFLKIASLFARLSDVYTFVQAGCRSLFRQTAAAVHQ